MSNNNNNDDSGLRLLRVMNIAMAAINKGHKKGCFTTEESVRALRIVLSAGHDYKYDDRELFDYNNDPENSSNGDVSSRG